LIAYYDKLRIADGEANKNKKLDVIVFARRSPLAQGGRGGEGCFIVGNRKGGKSKEVLRESQEGEGFALESISNGIIFERKAKSVCPPDGNLVERPK